MNNNKRCHVSLSEVNHDYIHAIDAVMVSDSPADTGSFGRVEFWRTGQAIDIRAITEDDVEDACLLRQTRQIDGWQKHDRQTSGKP